MSNNGIKSKYNLTCDPVVTRATFERG